MPSVLSFPFHVCIQAELASALENAKGQASPHPRILDLLTRAVEGRDLPEPFPWSKAADNELSVSDLREAIVGCGGSVAACGTNVANRNLMDLYCYLLNVEAVELLMELGGADLLNTPGAYGRTPIFSVAGDVSRKNADDVGKAMKLTKLLCDANSRLDLTDVDGHDLLCHVGSGMDQETQDIRALINAARDRTRQTSEA